MSNGVGRAWFKALQDLLRCIWAKSGTIGGFLKWALLFLGGLAVLAALFAIGLFALWAISKFFFGIELSRGQLLERMGPWVGAVMAATGIGVNIWIYKRRGTRPEQASAGAGAKQRSHITIKEPGDLSELALGDFLERGIWRR